MRFTLFICFLFTENRIESRGANEIGWALKENSSITELNIELKTLRDCNRNAVYHISDISKEILPALSFEAIADVTGAVIAMGTDVLGN